MEAEICCFTNAQSSATNIPFLPSLTLRLLLAEAPVNYSITDYDFLEDGDLISESLLLGDSCVTALSVDGEERPVLAELEGIVTKTPPGSAKKVCE